MKCLLIANPVSGKKKKFNLDYVLNRLKTKFEQVDYVESKYHNHVSEIIEDIGMQYDSIIVKGGDGTLNEAINALSEFENPPKLGYIPSGTTNDVGKTFGLSKNVKKSIDVILQDYVIPTDILQVNNKKAMYVCGVGMFTHASYATDQKQKQKLGRLAYLIMGFKEIFTAKTINVKLTANNQVYCGDCSLGLCLNSKWVGGFFVNKYAELNDGKIDVCFIFENKPRKKVSFLSKLTLLKLFMFGLHHAKTNKRLKVFKTDSCILQINGDENVTVDGECSTDKLLNIKVLKGRIKIYAKSHGKKVVG